MIEKPQLKILKLIEKNATITELIKDGYTYGQISRMVDELIKNDYLVDTTEKLTISKKGKRFLDDNFNINKLQGGEKWIMTEDKSRISRLNKNYIYLPNRNELFF